MIPSETIITCLRESPLHPHVIRILELIRKQGGRGLLVGGCIRDALCSVVPHDVDIEIYGLSQDDLVNCLKNDFRLDTVGASFGVTKVHHLDIDLSLPRSETKLGLGHRAFGIDVNPALSFKDATARRDLTVNAIMFDPLTMDIIDPWNGLQDLHKRILRHVSRHFAEDPLRVLRIMQFAARMMFEVAPETITLCSQITPEGLPRERLGAEWEKLLLKGVKPSLGLEFLRKCGWIDYYPELSALIGCKQTPLWHPEGDVWTHTLMALDAAAGQRPETRLDALAVMAAVLCHDMGKPATTVTDPDGFIRSRGHDTAGVEVARNFIRRLWLENDLEPLVCALVACHMRAHEVAVSDSDRAMRRLAVAVKRLDLLASVYEADVRASKHDNLDSVNHFRDMMKRLNIAQQAPKPLVMGRHLIDKGLQPSGQFKILLNKCFEAQLDGVFANLEGGLQYLDSLLK